MRKWGGVRGRPSTTVKLSERRSGIQGRNLVTEMEQQVGCWKLGNNFKYEPSSRIEWIPGPGEEMGCY